MAVLAIWWASARSWKPMARSGCELILITASTSMLSPGGPNRDPTRSTRRNVILPLELMSFSAMSYRLAVVMGSLRAG